MPDARLIDQRIIEFAGRRHGIVTTRQMLRLDVSRSAIDRRIASGWLVRLLPGVFAVATHGVDVSIETFRMAAVSSVAQPAALGMRTAFELHDIWTRRPRPGDPAVEVHLVVPRVVRSYGRGWLRLHRSTDICSEDIVIHDAMEVTSVARTLCDGGTFLTPYQLANMVGRAAYLHGLDRAAMSTISARRARAPGSAVVRTALALHASGSAGTKSWTEDRLLAAITSARLPIPAVNVRGITGLAGYEPDLAWLVPRLIVEVDGGGHELPGEREADAERDAWLEAHGWTVIRLESREVWRSLPQAVALVAEALDPPRKTNSRPRTRR